MESSFQSPLTLYILWHPDFADGAKLAQRLFGIFSRNVADPFARTPGIPLYFRSSPAGKDAKVPGPIPFEESEHTAIVVLVDENMVVDDDWTRYVEGLNRTASEPGNKTRLFPVAVNGNSFNLSTEITDTNFIRLYEVKRDQSAIPAARNGNNNGITINLFINGERPEAMTVDKAALESEPPAGDTSNEDVPDPEAEAEAAAAEENFLDRRVRFLTGKLAHELSRLLFHQPRMTDQATRVRVPPVKMFVSHAKADGADIAVAIRDQIHSDTSLKSFFDANDIAPGSRFSEELLEALKNSAIICVQTDYYATREWCLWEVIKAKKLNRPLIVVNAVKDREPRSFPYIGNVPTIRWQYDRGDDRTQIQNILDLAVFEVLGTRYRALFLKALVKAFNLPKDTKVIGRPPELFTALKLTANRSNGEDARYIVYPDPPLGDEELGLLKDMAPTLHFVTPTMLPLVHHSINTNST